MTTHELEYHIIFPLKYRRKVFYGEKRKEIVEIPRRPVSYTHLTPLEQLGSQINQYWEWIPRSLRAVQGVVETIGEIARSL